MSNKRDKTPTQDRFKPSGKLAEQQHNLDKEFQQIVQGFEQLGEPVEESVVNRSKVLEAASQSRQSRSKCKYLNRITIQTQKWKQEVRKMRVNFKYSLFFKQNNNMGNGNKFQCFFKIKQLAGDNKKKFKVNPNLKKSIDPELIKQQQKEEQEALDKLQAEQDEEIELATQKGVTFFGLEKSQTVTTKRKGFHGTRVSKDEFSDILSKEDGISIVQKRDNTQIIQEGTFEEEEIADSHKPENMFEPTKLPFVLGDNSQFQNQKNEKKYAHDILDSSKFNLLQFPAQFVYKLPQNSKTKLKLKKLDVEKLHDYKEILSFNAQKPYDSAGNSIKYNYSTIDYFAQRDPKKEQGYNMGKLRFYSDGSVQFICGQNIFDVTEGVQNQCKQSFVAIDQNMHLAEQPTMFNIDDISKKFVIQPNIDELYKK